MLNFKYSESVAYTEKDFYKKNLIIEGEKTPYYLSPLLEKHGFIHAFFTKNSSEIKLKLISNQFNKNYKNCFNKQIHSNKIIFGSETNEDNLVMADGMISDQINQNLWIYTADCMPILVADLKTKIVASLHCGRRGIENNLIKELVKLLKKSGSKRSNLLVAIGPTISSKKYTLDQGLYNEFKKKINASNISFNNFLHQNIYLLNSENKIELDLKKYAYYQFLKENIKPENIDISNKCTHISDNEFHSYRKNKTKKRQWSFISN
tara:strand:+ start:952 stop:1743 length:792 start_codon:yes stop_codon:yes gene_type:complete